MDPTDPPDDLTQVERALADRLLAPAPPALRGRILAAVHAELGRDASGGRWRLAAAVAAGAFIWANLSGSAAQVTDFTPSPVGEVCRVDNLAEQIERLVPDLSPAEARRQAILLCAASRLGRAAPALPVGRGQPMSVALNLLEPEVP